MRVLIIKLSSIGDVVHTLPALYALRKGLEKTGARAEIDWLVEEPASAILLGHPLIDNVIVVKDRGWTRDIKGNMKAARFLAGRGYDMALDFQGLLKSSVWVHLSRGGRKIGFSNSRELSPAFLNEKLPPYDPDRHAVDRYLDLA
ncbi:MAG: glycosyltransferase family 9 protein, partial [Deltaproteobacteria bacterium]|nr:glycosyltransferase family 9 protein [Deltaproteobacteria bacterium]